MTTFQTQFDSDDTQIKKREFLKEQSRFRARTRNKIHSLLLEEFSKFSAGVPSARSKLHDITGINKSTITRTLAGPKNLTIDSISDMLLAMGSRLEPRAVAAESMGQTNYIHPMSSLGSPQISNIESTAGTSAGVAVFQVILGEPVASRTTFIAASPIILESA